MSASRAKRSADGSSPVPLVENKVNSPDHTQCLKDQNGLRDEIASLKEQLVLCKEQAVKDTNSLMTQLHVEKESAMLLQGKLDRVRDYFNGVFLRKVKADRDAVKQSAHVKDLTKVAAHREISLERDKVLNELSCKNEIQDILTFAIATAEKSLHEVQPHVVVKLQEGRQKRIKHCQKLFAGRQKDLEQRSLETCVVSSSALDGFKLKADNKLLEAEGVIKKAIVVMNSFFE